MEQRVLIMSAHQLVSPELLVSLVQLFVAGVAFKLIARKPKAVKN
jgi:hypothetical protein